MICRYTDTQSRPNAVQRHIRRYVVVVASSYSSRSSNFSSNFSPLYKLWYNFQSRFLPERDYVTFGSLLSQFRMSVVCLSSVTLVHPTQGVEAFGNISSPLCTLAILWPPCKILRRSSQRNPSAGSVKCKRGIKIERSGPIEGYIS